MGSDRIGTKLNPRMGFRFNSLFQFESVIHNPDDKEMKYSQLFWSGGVDNTRWKKVQSDPIHIFLSENQLLLISNKVVIINLVLSSKTKRQQLFFKISLVNQI